jgi:hypothetical protein
MFRRRRTLMRAALVGGTAYYAGKKVAQGQEQEADQNAQIEQLQYQQQAAAAAPPAAPPAAAPPVGGISDATIQQLKELGQLKEQGILTDEEFAAQKHKLLGMS